MVKLANFNSVKQRYIKIPKIHKELNTDRLPELLNRIDAIEGLFSYTGSEPYRTLSFISIAVDVNEIELTKIVEGSLLNIFSSGYGLSRNYHRTGTHDDEYFVTFDIKFNHELYLHELCLCLDTIITEWEDGVLC